MNLRTAIMKLTSNTVIVHGYRRIGVSSIRCRSHRICIVVNLIGATVRYLVLPAACPRGRKVVRDSRTILSGSQDVSHPCLVSIDTAKLGDLTFILLSFIKLDMLSSALDMPLQCLALL